MNAEEIKKLRKSLKITQEELGRRIKVGGQTISRYEQGLTRPSKAIIRRLERQARKLK